MRVFDIKLGFNPATLAAGIGIALLAPPVISAAPRLLRSAVKTVIKAGYIISNKMRLVYWEKDPTILVGGGGEISSMQTDQDPLVYVSTKGKKYHKENCSFAADAENAIPLSEALETGYEPCKLCGG